MKISTYKPESITKWQTADFKIPISAYIHIPFCRRRCYYCDFPVSVVGDKARGDNSGTIVQYVEMLCREIEISPGFGKPLETVFFGGGTPSLLSVEQLSYILAVLEGKFGIADRAEISMEMDPGTFDLTHLKGYRDAGVNRISLGVQAFQDELLKYAGRSHTVADILAAVELICQIDVPNFSLDLISGLPYQTLEHWQNSLETAIAISPTHISVYDLIVEPVTAFARQYKPGSQPLPTDDTTVKMYKLAQQVLTSEGYQHYEISNYAQPGHQCRHNRVYWENRPYYGFGMGAASYLGGQRFTRERTRREYYEWVTSGCAIDCVQISADDILLETLMLGLRLASGLNLSALAQQFGGKTLEQIWHCLQPYYRQGWVQIVGIDGKYIDICDDQKLPLSGQLRLTDPEGFLFSNTILAALFEQLE
ncbi:radical SAM family heme chaperone HemW [Argonema antarcticum]|uniref:radical SAM family heme chaperone HemW n=1 Tax=Argonema antarcticum TaxID=2942763 RepID=UPI002013A48D|nr:radical SAM family heme chaperone HemW [Argonema antarcticum]MCL1475636.1 radical SAM family heme chaperone HemW [Argonema antarcticum A004/B2]